MFLAHLTKPATETTTTATVEPVNRIAGKIPAPVTSAAVITPPTITTTEPEPSTVVSEIITTKPAPVVVVRPAVPATVQPVEVFSEYESVQQLQPLRGVGRSGDFVHNNQTMDDKFRNVSTGWTKRANDPNDSRVMTWDSAFEHLERERGNTIDLRSSFGKLDIVNDSTGLALIDETGRRLNFTESSLDQFSRWIDCGLVLPRKLLTGDQSDRETLVSVFRNGLRKIADKNNLIRLRTDGTLRAVLSEQYAILDNRWFLEVLRRLIPDGLVSHFRSPDGCDSIFGNILIPDSMRAETDSEYGGMLAFGNGETGSRKLSTCPSVFRAICMNGCIWDELKGTGIIEKIHRGVIDLNALAFVIRDNLNRQIPLVNNGIDSMLATRSIVSDVSPLPAIGSVLRSLAIPGLTRVAGDAFLSSFDNQRTETGRVSAFDVIQGLTHAAQTFSPGLQETTERAAGSAMLWTAQRWDNVFAAAKTITESELKSVFANAV
jgi:hypothetical protein